MIPEVSKALLCLKSIHHPIRLSIVQYLHEKGRKNVNEIIYKIKLDQSKTSQQLRILKDQNIVFAEKEGKFVFYSLNYDTLEKIKRALDILEK
jgi:ArsR family transcriptional regulator, virulence genes transcriptional regulator